MKALISFLILFFFMFYGDIKVTAQTNKQNVQKTMQIEQKEKTGGYSNNSGSSFVDSLTVDILFIFKKIISYSILIGIFVLVFISSFSYKNIKLVIKNLDSIFFKFF